MGLLDRIKSPASCAWCLKCCQANTEPCKMKQCFLFKLWCENTIKIHIYALANIKMTMMFQTIKNAIASLYSQNIYLLLWIYYRFFLLISVQDMDWISTIQIRAIMPFLSKLLLKYFPKRSLPCHRAKEYNYVNETARSNTLRTFNICCIFSSKFSCDGECAAKKMEESKKSWAKKSNESISKMTFMKMPLSGCWSNCVYACGGRAASIFVCRGTHNVESQKFCIFICCFCCARVNANANGGRATAANTRKKA